MVLAAATVLPTAPPPTAVQLLVELTNVERRAVGCPDLDLDPRLSRAAQAHTDEMARYDYVGHTGLDGSSPGDRIEAAGYDWWSYGENVAAGQTGPAEVLGQWMESRGHRRNILDCDFRDIGIGFTPAPGGPYWAQEFGALAGR